MTAPPGTAPVQSRPDLGANQEGARRDHYLSAPILCREARKVAATLGLHLSGHTIRSVVAQFLNTGQAATEFRSWFLVYADPTGETAVANVMRERS